jgi:fibronectin-binding autotransporter adhesin
MKFKLQSHFRRRIRFALTLLLVAPGPGFAQDVLTSGDVIPSPADPSNWAAGPILTVGNTGTGMLAISGTGAVANQIGYIGRFLGSTGEVTVSGGSWTNSAEVYIGASGTGTLNISGGAVANTTAYVGLANAGHVTVSSGTWTNSAGLEVGVAGTGTLDITGGTVANTIGTIGRYDGATGHTTVSGGSWKNSSFLFVGDSGTGTLTISGEGTVTSANGSIGNNATGIGEVTVSGGNWSNSSYLAVGYTGNGTLTISDNGAVTNQIGYIGRNAGATGAVSISGGSWTNSSSLNVGSSGNGSLTISGGAVSNTVGFLGLMSATTGVATVSGGTWTNHSYLTVGNSGAGSLTISDTGLVSATHVTLAQNAGSTGTAALNGGTLTTGQIYKGGGTGTLTFNGGTLRLSGDQAGLFSGFGAGDVTLAGTGGTIDTQGFDVTTAYALSGAGGLTKHGAGTLTLAGTNTYAGVTAVGAGTLLITGSTAAGPVTLAGGATLGGNGTVGGNATLAGIHSPGASPGLQTFLGDLTYQSGAGVLWELVDNTALLAGRGADYDGINVGGTLDFAGVTTLDLNFSFAGSAVDWTDPFWTTGHTGLDGWLLYSGATALTGFGNLSVNSMNWLDGAGQLFNDHLAGNTFSLYQDGNNIYLNYTAVPEPGAAALLVGLGALAFMLWRRRGL